MKAFVLGCLVLLCCSWEFNRPERVLVSSSQQPQWFDQVLNHFDYLRVSHWKQRYFVVDTYFEPLTGPVILYLCGESICNGVPEPSWVAEIAKETKGLLIALEHRYYGESLPFRSDSLTLSNLKYLSSEQALKDIAYFITSLKKTKLYSISDATLWITFGGSYAGALSAWARAKYPHLISGALSLSGVVEAIDDFQYFDEQVFLSAKKSGDYCTKAISELIAYAQNQSLGPQRLNFQGKFGGSELTTREFMFYWADVIAMEIQYGHRETFCNSVHNKTFPEVLSAVTPLFLAVSPVDYGAFYLGDIQYALNDGRGARAWYYQSCTQFSFFQTHSQRMMRSDMLTLSFYHSFCANIFSTSILYANPALTNNEFGGLLLSASNVFITNGGEDPWKWASIQNGTAVMNKLINCSGCAHCAQFHASNKNDHKQIKEIRAEQLLLVKQWLIRQ